MVAIRKEDLVAYRVGFAHGVIGIARMNIEKLGYEGVGVPVVPGRRVLKSSDVLLEHVLCHYRGVDEYRNAYFDRKVREFFDLGVNTGGIPPFLVKNESQF